MASAKGVQHAHDRDPAKPRATCIQISVRSGVRCKRYAQVGSRLCRSHKLAAEGRLQGHAVKGGQGSKAKLEARDMAEDMASGGTRIQDRRMKSYQTATDLVVSEQARAALIKLGSPLSMQDKVDPKHALLDTVRTAVRQREVWETMLAAIPPEDWQYVGMPSIPGSKASSRGARIEVIQKNLAEATKNAARIAKLAIDAGIEERLVRLAEEQSALIADTVKAAVIAAIASLRLPVDAEATTIHSALGAAASHLRLLAAGGAGPTAVGGEIIEGIAESVDRPLALTGEA